MGCDYYIEYNLCITYNDNTSNYVTLNRERGYYSDYDDFIMSITNENNGISEWEKMKEYHLMPRLSPQIIYSNNTFTNVYVSKQYREKIEIEMYDFKSWDDIKDVVFLEQRYPRD